MFTGIIKAIGTIQSYDPSSHILTVACPLFSNNSCTEGASIAIDGVCLTVSHFDQTRTNLIGFDLGTETRAVSLLAHKAPHEMVNVEPALLLGAPLDGHIVQGHIDGIGKLVSIDGMGQTSLLTFLAPRELMPYVVKKGSIAIDGVSLTVNDVKDETFCVCLVPHTIEHTAFKAKTPGCLVHIETDIVGRYLYHFYTHLPSYQTPKT